MWYWFTDLIIPVFTTGMGAVLTRKPPRFGTHLKLRPQSAQRSQKTWDYTNRRLGEFWFKIGMLITIFVVLHRVFSPMGPMYITAINIAAGLACLYLGLPIVERELNEKFDEDGEPREENAG